MQALQVTLFSDGRPGHVKQSMGIVNALKAYTDVELNKVVVPDRHFLHDLGSHLSYLLHLGGATRSTGDLQADLLIGTGSSTHVPMLSTGRGTLAKTVACMTPAPHLRAKFDLCCVPIHDQVKPADNIFFTIGPPNISQVSLKQDLSRSLILIGGVDESSHSWDEQRLVADLSTLIESSEKTSWLISSSPRTPDSTELQVKQKLAVLPQVNFAPFAETEKGWLEEMYRIHGSIWITADSISMVYEALSAGCRVGVLPVHWRKKNNKFQRSLEYLL
ncbi:MAG: ELM1/GtrOC1 family putative glycosyltransferase, partial [Desulfocapsaceae bacterium]